MTPGSWARITELFGQAIECSPPDRVVLLDRLRRHDPEAADELASLLDAHDRDDEFLPDLPPPPMLADLSGRTLGAYRLIRLLGSGGMGAVYLAERSDGAYSRQVAVKLLSAAFLQARDRFHREREFLARFDHPNITRLFDAGATPDGLPYLVMEYVEGVPIDRYCREHDLSVDERLQLLLQVCAGVTHAHQSLIIHCDIKPENILVTADGVVKLLDFGIARLLDPGRRATVYRPATPAYSSPEQLEGDPITTASDVYSIGVLAYSVLTGSGPYNTRSGRLDEMMRAVLNAEPIRASQAPGLTAHHRRKLRGDLDNVLAKAVAKDPGRRYAGVQQLADDLEAYRKGFPVRARADTFFYRLKRGVGRHRVAVAAMALAFIALTVAAGVSAWQARVAHRRFEELRAFAHAVVFDVNDALTPIAGTTQARKLLVETALRYLDRLNQDGLSNPELRGELAAAYIRIGKVQGGAFLPNLGDTAGAIASFRKAIATVGEEETTIDLERMRIEALINVAQLATDPADGIPEFAAAIRAAERLLAANDHDVAGLRLVADAYHGEATIAHLTDRVSEHVAMSTAEIDVRRRISALAPDSWQDSASLARAVAQRALALEQQVDWAGAAADLRDARDILERTLARNAKNQMLLRGLAEVRSRTVSPFLGLGRAREAQLEAETAVRLLEPLVTSDPRNVQYRADLAYGWLRLGDAHHAQGHIEEALRFHRMALAVRRERAARSPGSMFVSWELTRSLNTVADLLLASSPPRPDEAAALFREARLAGENALARAPSHNQVRKQVANADEGIGRVLMRNGSAHARDARFYLERSAEGWRNILARGSGDRRDADAPIRIERLLASLPY
jgi:non-specific serine/threonine protein kinase/serine/threonine-protein kinase